MDTANSRNDAAARFPFDPIYKALCCHRATVTGMLHRYLVEPVGPLPRTLIEALDLRTLRKISPEWVTRSFRLRRADHVWQAEFREEARSQGYPPLMFINLEFQSRGNGEMALRFLDHGSELYRELRAQGAITEGAPCPILCILLHNGRAPWSAATSPAELVSVPVALGRATVPAGLAAFYPWGYWPVDFVALRDRPHIAGDIISMMVGIEFARERSDLVAPLWETVRNLADERLRQTVLRWLERLNEHYNLALPGLEELLAMEDVTVLTSRLDETIEGWRRDAVAEGLAKGLAEGLAEGREEGREEGVQQGVRQAVTHERSLLGRLAARRFGREAGMDLDTLLDGMADWDLLESVGESIIDARSADELTERVGLLIRQRR